MQSLTSGLPKVDKPLEELSDVLRGIREGRVIPLAITEGDSLIGLITLSNAVTALHVRNFAGDMPKGWEKPVTDMLRDFAASFNKSRVQLLGRKAWIRKLKPYGYKPEGKYLVAEVNRK